MYVLALLSLYFEFYTLSVANPSFLSRLVCSQGALTNTVKTDVCVCVVELTIAAGLDGGFG